MIYLMILKIWKELIQFNSSKTANFKFGRDLNAVGFGLSVDEVFDVVKISKKGEN